MFVQSDAVAEQGGIEHSQESGSRKKGWQLEILSQSEELVGAPKQLGVIPGSGSQSSHNAQGLKEPIGPRRRPAGPYKYCIGARQALKKAF